jgi:hypothetical protein
LHSTRADLLPTPKAQPSQAVSNLLNKTVLARYEPFEIHVTSFAHVPAIAEGVS